ncbi:MAG: hypothetical protein ACPGED_04345, partial [Flavobacteriales bacterium]
MIRYNPKDWFGLIFQFHKSDTFRQLGWVLLAFTFFAAIIVGIELYFFDDVQFTSTTAIHSLMGFVIGLFLVFRT